MELRQHNLYNSIMNTKKLFCVEGLCTFDTILLHPPFSLWSLKEAQEDYRK